VGGGRREGEREERDGNLLEFDVPKSIAYGSFMFPPSAKCLCITIFCKILQGDGIAY
jgi:hypothetical protein